MKKQSRISQLASEIKEIETMRSACSDEVLSLMDQESEDPHFIDQKLNEMEDFQKKKDAKFDEMISLMVDDIFGVDTEERLLLSNPLHDCYRWYEGETQDLYESRDSLLSAQREGGKVNQDQIDEVVSKLREYQVLSGMLMGKISRERSPCKLGEGLRALNNANKILLKFKNKG